MFGQGASRRLIAAFVLLLLLPAVAVVWLGVRLIIQDRQLESEQLRKQRESAANLTVKALNERLSSAERNLDAVEPPGDDAVTMVLGADGVESRPAMRLLKAEDARASTPGRLNLPGESIRAARRASPDARSGAWRVLSAPSLATAPQAALPTSR